jgi:hypothetical protein
VRAARPTTPSGPTRFLSATVSVLQVQEREQSPRADRSSNSLSVAPKLAATVKLTIKNGSK